MAAHLHNNTTLIFLCLFLPVLQGHSQMLSDEVGLPYQFKFRVNSIESFMYRFNLEEDVHGNRYRQDTAALTEKFVTDRNRMILSLFDYQKYGKASNVDKRKILDFLQAVNSVNKQVRLDFYDTNWFAEVTLDILYKQKPEQLTLILQQEQTLPRVSHWAIRAVKADFLDLKLQKKDSTKIIAPNSHGTDFISIPKDLSSPEAIVNFAAPGVTLDMLSVFFYAVKNGEISLKKARQVKYHFLQIDNWIVRVEEKDHHAFNGGWLVAELIQADAASKHSYLLKELNIH